jgi:hypothetical protein
MQTNQNLVFLVFDVTNLFDQIAWRRNQRYPHK